MNGFFASAVTSWQIGSLELGQAAVYSSPAAALGWAGARLAQSHPQLWTRTQPSNWPTDALGLWHCLLVSNAQRMQLVPESSALKILP